MDFINSADLKENDGIAWYISPTGLLIISHSSVVSPTGYSV
jgi:hypothetical protein